MKSFQKLGAAAFLTCLSSSLSFGSDPITLTAIVRDFTPAHPDFESYLGSDPGIVESILGGDGKPVYAGTAGNPTTTGAAYFDEWFHRPLNIGVDAAYVPITLTESGGTYSYSNFSFFPIDGQLLGDYALGHNYHFTLELHTTFTYTGPQTFSFSGDDDVWVFINDELVIDLGGVHGTESDSVDTGELGLTLGQDYDLDFFFAERHTSGSNFSIETGLQLVDNPEPVVPEPATWLGAAAVAGLAMLRRRKS